MPKVDKCGQGGREGVKNGTFVRTSFMDGPISIQSTAHNLQAYIMMSILRLTVHDEEPLWHGLVLVAALITSNILSDLLFIGSITCSQIAGEITGITALQTPLSYSSSLTHSCLASQKMRDSKIQKLQENSGTNGLSEDIIMNI